MYEDYYVRSPHGTHRVELVEGDVLGGPHEAVVAKAGDAWRGHVADLISEVVVRDDAGLCGGHHVAAGSGKEAGERQSNTELRTL